jgi:uncharacterized protein (TIGR03067 family)
MKNLLLSVLLGAATLASGCAGLHKSDTAQFQGNWAGDVFEHGKKVATCTFAITGNTFDFHSGEAPVYYKGTFTLREDTTPKQFLATVMDCSISQYKGKTSVAIYKLEDGKLTITANEPGKQIPPVSFDAPDASSVVLTKR